MDRPSIYGRGDAWAKYANHLEAENKALVKENNAKADYNMEAFETITKLQDLGEAVIVRHTTKVVTQGGTTYYTLPSGALENLRNEVRKTND